MRKCARLIGAAVLAAGCVVAHPASGWAVEVPDDGPAGITSSGRTVPNEGGGGIWHGPYRFEYECLNHERFYRAVLQDWCGQLRPGSDDWWFTTEA